MGTYSPGKLSVVYDISMQVLPTVPSPTTTHFIGLPEDIVILRKIQKIITEKYKIILLVEVSTVVTTHHYNCF